MKYSFCFLLFLLLACAKGDKPQISIAPVSPSFEIEASENLLVEVYNIQHMRVVDTFLANTDFFLYELGNTVAYPLQLRFKAVQTNPAVRTYPVTSYSWRIGPGPLRVGKEVWVDFSRPVGTISVTLLIEYNKNGNLLTDTFTKQINVGSSSSFGGNYSGVITTEGQADRNAVVQVGVLQSSSGNNFYGIRNVVPGFPVEINITPTSRAFGFDFSFFTTQTQFNVNNVVMSLPQGIGYLKGDSLYINYGYRQFPAMGELQNYQTKKLQYRGKKI